MYNYIVMNMRNNLANIRKRKGLSQTQLAMKTGIDRRVIGDIELEVKIPSLKKALLLSKALNCSVNEIFILDDKQ